MMRALRYAVEEALVSLWRGRKSGLLSTATIALALFVLGAFLIVTANLQYLATQWSNGAELSVYLADEVTPEQRQAVEAVLAPNDAIASREFVSKADALSRFKQTFSDLASTIDTLGDNPLPASYEVRMRPASNVGATVDQLASQVRVLPGVADVRYDRQWIGRLLAAVRIVRGIGIGLGLLLTVAAALTVANVVRLALYARRDELEIMQLVGAPNAYVRGPFVMEGVLQGGIGALASLIVLGLVFVAVRGRFLVPLANAINLPSIRFLPVELCLVLVLGGMAVGCVGGMVAAWRS
jgi:cell division transport system permease protein